MGNVDCSQGELRLVHTNITLATEGFSPIQDRWGTIHIELVVHSQNRLPLPGLLFSKRKTMIWVPQLWDFPNSRLYNSKAPKSDAGPRAWRRLGWMRVGWEFVRLPIRMYGVVPRFGGEFVRETKSKPSVWGTLHVWLALKKVLLFLFGFSGMIIPSKRFQTAIEKSFLPREPGPCCPVLSTHNTTRGQICVFQTPLWCGTPHGGSLAGRPHSLLIGFGEEAAIPFQLSDGGVKTFFKSKHLDCRTPSSEHLACSACCREQPPPCVVGCG